MWTYIQSKGVLFHDSDYIGVGYSGYGMATNCYNYQSIKNIGPIPVGNYTIGEPTNHPKLGPNAIPLTPNPNNEMYGRSDFFMHGDSIEHPGFASDGCIIMIPSVREQVIKSTDKELQVVQ